jgi:hypothetical protein
MKNRRFQLVTLAVGGLATLAVLAFSAAAASAQGLSFGLAYLIAGFGLLSLGTGAVGYVRNNRQTSR